jgi:hypothetical protein
VEFRYTLPQTKEVGFATVITTTTAAIIIIIIIKVAAVAWIGLCLLLYTSRMMG